MLRRIEKLNGITQHDQRGEHAKLIGHLCIPRAAVFHGGGDVLAGEFNLAVFVGSLGLIQELLEMGFHGGKNRMRGGRVKPRARLV